MVLWLDPKLAKFRPQTPPYKPESLAALLALLRRTPKSVLSNTQRDIIVNAMNFSTYPVDKLMLPKTEITYVRENDVLGPLMLDRLYKTGLAHFPVLSTKGDIIGMLHTEALNALEVKNTDKATKYLDPKVYYLRSDYSLNQALAAFMRTNSYFFLVIDKAEQVVGLLTYQMLATYLLGDEPHDDFSRDDDRHAVAKRVLY